MYSAESETRRRPLVLGLLLLVHLVLGYLILSAGNAGSGQTRRVGGGFVSGSSGMTGLRVPEAITQAPSAKPYHLSFDREALVGPSTRPPPTRHRPGTHKVAPPSYPS